MHQDARPMLQCQREAARFALGAPRVEEIGVRTRREAIRRLRSGDFAGALEVMYAGLAEQAPLSFKPPAVTP